MYNCTILGRELLATADARRNLASFLSNVFLINGSLHCVALSYVLIGAKILSGVKQDHAVSLGKQVEQVPEGVQSMLPQPHSPHEHGQVALESVTATARQPPENQQK